MSIVNEESAVTVTVSFFNDAGEPKTPAGVEYRIDCKTTRKVVRDWTSLTAAPVIAVNVLPEENRILQDKNRRERKVMTVRSNTDTPTQIVTDTYSWFVDNGIGIS